MNIDDKYVFAIQGRTIMPSISSQIAVATDINSRRIVFKIPMYIDGYNDNDSIISVRCVNAAKKFSQQVLTEREIRSGDDNTYIYTVEGNTVAKGEKYGTANNSRVVLKRYDKNSGVINGYFRPYY